MKWIASVLVAAAASTSVGSTAQAASREFSLGAHRGVPAPVCAPAPAVRIGARWGSAVAPVRVAPWGRHGRYHRHCGPVYDRVWVAPVYRRVVVGYDRCGYAITRQVLVRAGYWRTVRVR